MAAKAFSKSAGRGRPLDKKSNETPPDTSAWTIEDVALFLNIGVRTAWRWHAEKQLPAGKKLPGGAVRWNPRTIKEWFERQPAANT